MRYSKVINTFDGEPLIYNITNEEFSHTEIIYSILYLIY
jgi:hypothetical protein